MNSSHTLGTASLVVGAAALALLASCTTATKENNHWLVESVGPRITFHFLGYEPAEDGRYYERLSQDGDAFGLTIRRHFLSDDPTNPMQPQNEKRSPPPQPPNVEFKVHG